MNATPYSVSKEDYILVEIMHNNNFIVSSREYGGEKWRDGNAMRVSFSKGYILLSLLRLVTSLGMSVLFQFKMFTPTVWK